MVLKGFPYGFSMVFHDLGGECSISAPSQHCYNVMSIPNHKHFLYKTSPSSSSPPPVPSLLLSPTLSFPLPGLLANAEAEAHDMRGSIDTREIELKTVQDAATAAQSACSSLEANSAELQQRLEDRRQVRDNAASAAKRLAASVEVRHTDKLF